MSTPTQPVTPQPDPERVLVRRYEPFRYAEPQGFTQRMVNAIPAGARQVNVPNGVPRILGNRSVVFNAWIIAMIVIGFDEWHNLHIFPRPLRLWYATLFYGILLMVGIADVMVPIVNAFAVGYTLMLIWQYYNGGLTPGTPQGKGTIPGSQQPGTPNPRPNATPTPGGGVVTPANVLKPNPTPAPGG